MSDVSVSIICNTYNHEKYIRSALDGFLMQKTNFTFEVLIHDDASTDQTADIIREYEKNFPDIIKPIYQKENQYSKGNSVSIAYQYPRISGEYVAVCEGDDYWTDPYKLQKQYDVMEQHPEVDICAHGAAVEMDRNIIRYVSPSDQQCIFDLSEVIKGGGGFVATASLFYRARMEKEEWPEFRKVLLLDYTVQIHGAMRGGMIFIPDCMSVYRKNTESSWSIRMATDYTARIKHYQKVAMALSQLNIDTNYEHDTIISLHLNEIQFDLDYWTGKYIKLLNKHYRDIFKKKSVKKRIYIYVMAAIPKVCSDKIRNYIKNG